MTLIKVETFIKQSSIEIKISVTSCFNVGSISDADVIWGQPYLYFF